MKKCKLIKLAIALTLILLNINCKAQDIITKKDGTEIKAKVLELSPTEIKYKRFDYLDGPTVIIYITDINNIKYSNGTSENFTKSSSDHKHTSSADTTNEINDGVVKKNYPTGELLCETPYLNGKINGIQKLYYKSGSLLSETPFKDGLANGTCTTYYKSGKWIKKIPYVDGEVTGIIENSVLYRGANSKFVGNKTYYKNGILKCEIPKSNGVINGFIKYYHENGNIKSEYPYVNNLCNGIVKGYDKKGIWVASEHWVDGENVDKDNTLAAVVQGVQQAVAYNNMTTNTNSQTVNEYTQVAVNNFTNPGSLEVLNANNKILENSNSSSVTNTNNGTNSQIQSESSASTNGGSFNKNAAAAKKCADETKASWELKPNYQNSKNNPGCSKMALIAQRELAEMLLQNCSEYLPPSELEGMKKTRDSLTSQINGTPDCKSYNYGK